jgi:hypothetical protein
MQPEVTMKQLLLTLAATILLAGSAFAQTPGPGGDKAVTSTPATATEKATAKASRKAEGAAIAKTAQPGDDRPATAAKVTAKSERKLAAAKRKVEGAKVSKQPKEVTGTNN